MRRALTLMLLVALLATPAWAATRAHRAKPSRPHAVKPTSTTSTAPAPASSRTLGDIHIEGEIAVPQVLFITARDQRRIVDLQHKRYLETSRELGERTILPSRVVTPASPPQTSGKETPR